MKTKNKKVKKKMKTKSKKMIQVKNKMMVIPAYCVVSMRYMCLKMTKLLYGSNAQNAYNG